MFLVVNLSGVRCTDDGQMSGLVLSSLAETVTAGQSDNVVEFFNQRLQTAPLQPIQEQESTPSRLEGAAEGLGICGEEVCRSLAEQYRGLMFGASGAMLAPGERAGAEWTARLRKLLTTLEQWQPGGDAAGHFREKASAYNELLSIASGAGRQMVASAELDFLLHAQSRLPTAWSGSCR